MPIYEYRCEACGKTFDSIQKFSDEPFTTCGQSTVECPQDRLGKVARLMSSPAFHFKGTGFYITDYNKGSGGAKDTKPASSSSSDSGSSSDSSSGKSESKPAAGSSSDASGSSSNKSGGTSGAASGAASGATSAPTSGTKKEG